MRTPTCISHLLICPVCGSCLKVSWATWENEVTWLCWSLEIKRSLRSFLWKLPYWNVDCKGLQGCTAKSLQMFRIKHKWENMFSEAFWFGLNCVLNSLLLKCVMIRRMTTGQMTKLLYFCTWDDFSKGYAVPSDSISFSLSPSHLTDDMESQCLGYSYLVALQWPRVTKQSSGPSVLF